MICSRHVRTELYIYIPLPKNHKKFFCEVTSNLKLKLRGILLLDTLRNLSNHSLLMGILSFCRKLGNIIMVTEFCGSSCRIRIV